LVLGLFIHGGRNQRRRHWSWTNSVETNALTKLLIRKISGEGNGSFFSGGVVEQVRAADVGVVNDGAAGQGILGEVEG
jgi:hypothetical protein